MLCVSCRWWLLQKQAERSAQDEQGGRYKGIHLHIIRSDQKSSRIFGTQLYSHDAAVEVEEKKKIKINLSGLPFNVSIEDILKFLGGNIHNNIFSYLEFLKFRKHFHFLTRMIYLFIHYELSYQSRVLWANFQFL